MRSWQERAEDWRLTGQQMARVVPLLEGRAASLVPTFVPPRVAQHEAASSRPARPHPPEAAPAPPREGTADKYGVDLEEFKKLIRVDLKVPPGVRSVVITGPNTGGKTICLKTLGIAALMAKAGLRVLCADEAVPAREGGRVVVPFYQEVMADIGDDQSIVQSLSTFSAHVARLQRILDRVAASPRACLVLLDEVGSGTDPAEGSALGMAVLRRLRLHAGGVLTLGLLPKGGASCFDLISVMLISIGTKSSCGT